MEESSKKKKIKNNHFAFSELALRMIMISNLLFYLQFQYLFIFDKHVYSWVYAGKLMKEQNLSEGQQQIN